MVDYVVNLKINDKDFDKVKKELNTAKIGVATSGESVKPNSVDKKIASGIFSAVGKLGVIAAIISTFSDILSPLLNLLKYFILVMLAPVLKPLLKWLNKVLGGSKIKDTANKVGEAVADTMPSVAAAKLTAEAVEKGAPIIKSAFEHIKNFFKEAGSWLGEEIRKAFSFLKGAGGYIWNLMLQSFAVLKGVGSFLWSSVIVPAFQTLQDAGAKLWSGIIEPAFQTVTGWADKIWKFFQKGFAKVLNFGKRIWTDYISKGFKTALNWGRDIWTNYIKPAAEGVASAIRWVQDKIRNAWNRVRDAAKSVWEKIHPSSSEGSKAFGGTVPTTGFYKLHAGETVITHNQTVTNTPSVNVTVNVNGSLQDNADEIARLIGEKIRQYTSW